MEHFEDHGGELDAIEQEMQRLALACGISLDEPVAVARVLHYRRQAGDDRPESIALETLRGLMALRGIVAEEKLRDDATQ